jgi:NADH/NAD ratio-sensing transcriptional regulator Rex
LIGGCTIRCVENYIFAFDSTSKLTVKLHLYSRDQKKHYIFMSTMSSSNSQVKFALIGMGLIGPRHAQAIQQDEDADLICFVDPSPDAAKAAATFGVPIYSSIQKMLQAQKPDAAIVCTPNHTHVAVSKELLDNGINVLVEKPISTDVESGKELVSRKSVQ